MGNITCRRLQDKNVVWFGSIGTNDEGKKIVANDFAKQQEAVAQSLTQNLLVLQYELWYDIYAGLPLYDKIKSKVEVDAIVARIILSNSNVLEIIRFKSDAVNRKYTCNVQILTIFGSTDIII